MFSFVMKEPDFISSSLYPRLPCPRPERETEREREKEKEGGAR